MEKLELTRLVSLVIIYNLYHPNDQTTKPLSQSEREREREREKERARERQRERGKFPVKATGPSTRGGDGGEGGGGEGPSHFLFKIKGYIM